MISVALTDEMVVAMFRGRSLEPDPRMLTPEDVDLLNTYLASKKPLADEDVDMDDVPAVFAPGGLYHADQWTPEQIEAIKRRAKTEALATLHIPEPCGEQPLVVGIDFADSPDETAAAVLDHGRITAMAFGSDAVEQLEAVIPGVPPVIVEMPPIQTAPSETDWNTLVERVLAGESASAVAHEAGVRVQTLAVRAAHARKRLEKASPAPDDFPKLQMQPIRGSDPVGGIRDLPPELAWPEAQPEPVEAAVPQHRNPNDIADRTGWTPRQELDLVSLSVMGKTDSHIADKLHRKVVDVRSKRDMLLAETGLDLAPLLRALKTDVEAEDREFSSVAAA